MFLLFRLMGASLASFRMAEKIVVMILAVFALWTVVSDLAAERVGDTMAAACHYRIRADALETLRPSKVFSAIKALGMGVFVQGFRLTRPLSLRNALCVARFALTFHYVHVVEQFIATEAAVGSTCDMLDDGAAPWDEAKVWERVEFIQSRHMLQLLPIACLVAVELLSSCFFESFSQSKTSRSQTRNDDGASSSSSSSAAASELSSSLRDFDWTRVDRKIAADMEKEKKH